MMATASSIVWLWGVMTPAHRPRRWMWIRSATATILFRRIDADTSPVQTHIVPVSLIPGGSGEISALAG